MAHPTIQQNPRKNDLRLAAFRANAAGVCTKFPQDTNFPQKRNSEPKQSLTDIIFDEEFGAGAFLIGGKGDQLARRDPRFTSSACLNEAELAEYAAETGDYSYSGDTSDSYGYGDGYEDVYESYLEAEEENYRIEQYSIYDQEQYQRDLENGDSVCVAPWASDEDPYDFAITQESASPDTADISLGAKNNPEPAEEASSTPVAAAFNDAASGVEPAPSEPAPSEPAPAEPSSTAAPAPAAEPETAPAVIKVAASPAAAPAI